MKDSLEEVQQTVNRFLKEKHSTEIITQKVKMMNQLKQVCRDAEKILEDRRNRNDELERSLQRFKEERSDALEASSAIYEVVNWNGKYCLQ